MSKVIFSYRKLTALCVVLAITLFQGMSTTRATLSPSPTPTFSNPNLTDEAKVLEGFLSELVLFDKRVVALGKKDSIPRAEFESHRRIADSLKRRLSAVQSALGSVMAKLKAAHQ